MGCCETMIKLVFSIFFSFESPTLSVVHFQNGYTLTIIKIQETGTLLNLKFQKPKKRSNSNKAYVEQIEQHRLFRNHEKNIKETIDLVAF